MNNCYKCTGTSPRLTAVRRPRGCCDGGAVKPLGHPQPPVLPHGGGGTGRHHGKRDPGARPGRLVGLGLPKSSPGLVLGGWRLGKEDGDSLGAVLLLRVDSPLSNTGLC